MSSDKFQLIRCMLSSLYNHLGNSNMDIYENKELQPNLYKCTNTRHCIYPIKEVEQT